MASHAKCIGRLAHEKENIKMALKYCQGPDCHTYTTGDRLKGTKPNKTYQTRRRSRMYYGRGNFCDRMHVCKMIGLINTLNRV